MTLPHVEPGRNRALRVSLCALCLMMTTETASAQAEIFKSMTSEACTAASRGAVANNARENIESRVARAEASIQPPMPVGELACLDDLMTIDTDFLSGDMFSVGDIFGDLMSGLGTGTITDAAGNAVSRQICQFASEKWGELTEPLSLGAAELSNQIASNNLTDGFAFVNFAPSNSPAAGAPTASPSSASAPQPAPAGPSTGSRPSVGDTIQGIYDNLNTGN